MVIDGGILMAEGSTVISLLNDQAEILRHGSGDTAWLEEV
jgi:tRNA A37 threonylcarbamoyladenosine synthetase subunit TsaC/SUA5/YrdC